MHKASGGKETGTAVFFALMPVLMEDKEFKEQYLTDSYPIYRRIENGDFSGYNERICNYIANGLEE